jgi:shikimate kinase
LLANDPAGTLARLAAEREPLYRETAHEVVDVGTLSPADVVDRILALTGAAA